MVSLWEFEQKKSCGDSNEEVWRGLERCEPRWAHSKLIRTRSRTVQEPFGIRSKAVHELFRSRSGSVQTPVNNTPRIVQKLSRNRAGAVQEAFMKRSKSDQNSFKNHS